VPAASRTSALRRSVVLQMPITGLFVALPLIATFAFGTCSATELTLYPARVSVPSSEASPP
jgi:hypothetical protein